MQEKGEEGKGGKRCEVERERGGGARGWWEGRGRGGGKGGVKST